MRWTLRSPDVPVRHPIPWITQYATPSLIAAIAYQGHPAADDPRWRESGAPDQEAYGRWCTRLCGMACLRMALIARDGRAPSLFALLDGCLDYGGYVEEPGGRVTGLLYRQFADFTRDRYDLHADVITDLDPSRIIRECDQGRLVMASVHKEIRRPELGHKQLWMICLRRSAAPFSKAHQREHRLPASRNSRDAQQNGRKSRHGTDKKSRCSSGRGRGLGASRRRPVRREPARVSKALGRGRAWWPGDSVKPAAMLSGLPTDRRCCDNHVAGLRGYGSRSLPGQLISAWASESSDASNRPALALTPARARVSMVWATCESLNDSTPWALVWELTVTPLVASAARYSPW